VPFLFPKNLETTIVPIGTDRKRGAKAHNKKKPPLLFLIFTIILFLFLKFLFFLFFKKLNGLEICLRLWKILFEIKKQTLKQKRDPRVVVINISRKVKSVVISAIDAANKNFICARKNTYM